MQTDSGSISLGEAEHAAHSAINIAVDSALAQTEQTLEAVIDNAAEAIDAAQENAAKLAEAAMQTEIGRRVYALEEEVSYKWPDKFAELARQLSELATELSQMRAAISATATLVVADQLQPTMEQSSSTPPLLGEISTPLAEVIPEGLELPSVVENPAPPTPRKRRFF